MRYVLLFVIHVYWRIVPPGKRQNCLFKESCSRHVYRKAAENGLIEGLRAFYTRVKQCRPGYRVNRSASCIELELKDKTILKEDEIAEMLLSSWKR